MKALFSTSTGRLADLHQLEQGAQTEAATVKQGLMKSAQEASMIRIRILKRVSMGWCSALAGEERDVTEEQLATLEKELPGRTERVPPKAEPKAATEELADDVPGTPPVPEAKDKKLGAKKGKRRRRREA